MSSRFKFFFFFIAFAVGFFLGRLGCVYGLNELRMQECLIIEKKLQQYAYMQVDLSQPVKKRKVVHFPDDLSVLGPVYGHIWGISYEIDKDKFSYEPSLSGDRYSLEVSLAYGKRYVSPRSI